MVGDTLLSLCGGDGDAVHGIRGLVAAEHSGRVWAGLGFQRSECVANGRMGAAFGGGGLALWCVWEFAWTGRGTPAPWDPPRVLVVKGLYRYVRNPMYVKFATGVFGLWVLIERANSGALWYTIGVGGGL